MEDRVEMVGEYMNEHRVSFMGVPIDAMTLEQTVEHIIGRIQEGLPTQHVAINPGKIIRMMEDEEIREIVHQCEVISTDGVGVYWFSKMLGCPIPERVTGIDLMDKLLEEEIGDGGAAPAGGCRGRRRGGAIERPTTKGPLPWLQMIATR